LWTGLRDRERDLLRDRLRDGDLLFEALLSLLTLRERDFDLDRDFDFDLDLDRDRDSDRGMLLFGCCIYLHTLQFFRSP